MSGKVEFKTPSGGSVGLSFEDTATDDVLELPAGNGDLYGQQNILGTVSQVGGVPTGAIIERGSNANGEYIKYADGTMVCWNENVGSLSVTGSAGNIFRSSGGLGWVYPVEFISKPTSASTISEATFAWTNTKGNSTTSASIRAYGTANVATTYVISASALGRWY